LDSGETAPVGGVAAFDESAYTPPILRPQSAATTVNFGTNFCDITLNLSKASFIKARKDHVRRRCNFCSR
jgi:hypothetical protein